MSKPSAVVIGGMGRGVPRVRFKRHRTPRSILRAYFRPMKMAPEDVQETPAMEKGMVQTGAWAFVASRRKVPVIHYWASRHVEPLHLAYILAHEVGHVSGRPLRARRNAWREECRADEYGAAAFLALEQVLGRRLPRQRRGR